VPTDSQSVPDPIASAMAHPIMLIEVIDNITNNAVSVSFQQMGARNRIYPEVLQ